jgi:hypothetical protein
MISLLKKLSLVVVVLAYLSSPVKAYADCHTACAGIDEPKVCVKGPDGTTYTTGMCRADCDGSGVGAYTMGACPGDDDD